MTLAYNYNNQNQQELNSNIEERFDLRFSTIKNTCLTTSHHILNRKLLLFLNQTHSLKQFMRVKYKICLIRINNNIYDGICFSL